MKDSNAIRKGRIWWMMMSFEFNIKSNVFNHVHSWSIQFVCLYVCVHVSSHLYGSVVLSVSSAFASPPIWSCFHSNPSFNFGLSYQKLFHAPQIRIEISSLSFSLSLFCSILQYFLVGRLFVFQFTPPILLLACAKLRTLNKM